MPVRKIPKNYLSVTGKFSSTKNGKSLGYESLLERDLMILLEFDDTVERFEEQPVKVPLVVNGKKLKPYVPDILIHYFPTSSGEAKRPVLGEVKKSDDLKKNKEKYAPKFEAASRYANERDWEWQIFTEKEIRTPCLDNLKFLRDYHNKEPDAALQQEVVSYLQNVRGTVTVESLLQKLCLTEDRVLHVTPALWYLIATKRITVNLQKLLTTKSKLSLP
jgi:hypothetical protein